MDAHRELVDEVATIHAGDVHLGDASVGERLDGGVEPHWNLERTGEEVHRARGQDAERNGAARHGRGCRRHGSVAAPDHEDVEVRPSCLRLDALADLGSVDEFDLRLVSVDLELAADGGAQKLQIRGAQGAAVPVEDGVDFHDLR